MDDKVILPPKYYHANFEYLLSFVKDKYKPLLNTAEWHFLRKYYGLPEDAQCLFVRFCNRKGLFFKTSELKYDEISDLDAHLQKLLSAGFISPLNTTQHSGFIDSILVQLTKTDLVRIFDLKSLKNEKKEILIEHIKQNVETTNIFDALNANETIIKVNFEIEVSFLKFLFFGNRFMDMTEFVLRDMGLTQYHSIDHDDLVARFETRKDAEDKWMISEQFVVFEHLKAVNSSNQMLDWFMNLRQSISSLSPIAVPSYEKLVLKVGKYLEQIKDYEAAISVYETIVLPPSRERITRCLYKLKLMEEAKELCHEMLRSSDSIDEQYFASYFLKTLEGKKNKKQTTEFLHTAEIITIDKMYKNQVEWGAIEYYLEDGFLAGFSENFTWRSIFGLVFWDIIFDPSLVAFHHPFQKRPSDLHLPDFYIKRKLQIENHLGTFDDSDCLLGYMRQNFVKFHATANPFVVWSQEVWEMVMVLVTRIELVKMKAILMKIAENIVEHSRGMPDLLVWTEDYYELVEIKSPSDNLSHQQLFWFRYFKDLGVNAKVLRVRFSD
jgi:tetratricopeptide (TPR) repeat protein